MLLIPITTPILNAGDDLATILSENSEIRAGDIIVISSKAIATVEGAAIELGTLSISPQAIDLSRRFSKTPALYQAVLDETARMHGTVIPAVNGFVLTQLKPDGMTDGTLLVPNAGIDQSNVDEGYAIGWPKDPVSSVKRLRNEVSLLMKDRYEKSGTLERLDTRPTSPTLPSLPTFQTFPSGVIISDSGLAPRRRGVTAFALCCAGFNPIVSLVDTRDLFGKALLATEEALADQLATAANTVMGNSAQSTPAAVIREHGIAMSDFCGWVPGIEREKDLYHGVI